MAEKSKPNSAPPETMWRTARVDAASPDQDVARLRNRAEQKARELKSQEIETQSPAEARQVLHELLVHQIELEMQNEELRSTREQLEASRVRYFDLYDLAPVGYFTLSRGGRTLEANLTDATLLGVARSALSGKQLSRFIPADHAHTFYSLAGNLSKKGGCGSPAGLEGGAYQRLRRADGEDSGGRRKPVASFVSPFKSRTSCRLSEIRCPCAASRVNWNIARITSIQDDRPRKIRAAKCS